VAGGANGFVSDFRWLVDLSRVACSEGCPTRYFTGWPGCVSG
jgi:hypothetical protein